MTPSVPLAEVGGRVFEALRSFGAEPSDLYRALSNNEEIADLWIRFAWGLRTASKTPRALRELMILRCAQLQDAEYQWRDHTAMARDSGVSGEQVADLDRWQSSERFDEPTRACLALTDETVAGHVSEETLRRLADLFPPDERVELIVTAAFYCMVPRVLDALRLAPEQTGE